MIGVGLCSANAGIDALVTRRARSWEGARRDGVGADAAKELALRLLGQGVEGQE
jgi:hypothetical protein